MSFCQSQKLNGRKLSKTRLNLFSAFLADKKPYFYSRLFSMELQKVSQSILNQLIVVSKQLPGDQFSQQLDVLSGNTIGKHIRHIIEFFDLMIIGADSGFVNYDQRSHDKVIETNHQLAIEKMNSLKQEIESVSEDFPLTLQVNYDADESKKQSVKSSYYRELQYNIEHAIHHMAIIKIALKTCFEEVELPDNFGVAYSTVRYQKKLECAQ